MKFTDLVPGDVVFVDANIFVYHFAPDPVLQMPCGQFLQRIENQEIHAFTSTHVLAEAAHRLLTLEARTHFGWSSGKVVQRLKQNPSSMHNLTQFRIAIEHVAQSRIVRLAGLCGAPGDGRRLLPTPWTAHYRRPIRRTHAGPRPDQAGQR